MTTLVLTHGLAQDYMNHLMPHIFLSAHQLFYIVSVFAYFPQIQIMYKRCIWSEIAINKHFLTNFSISLRISILCEYINKKEL